MKERQAKFELLRILCMYMIVVGHCLFHGRVTAKLGYGKIGRASCRERVCQYV